MKIITLLLVVSLSGCAASGMPYYGEYTKNGTAVEYTQDREVCRKMADEKAAEEVPGGGFLRYNTEVWLNARNKYVQQCMGAMGYSWVKNY